MEDYIEDDEELTFDENLEVVPTTKESELVKKTQELVDSILDVDNSEELKRATALFNQNIAKKNMLRLLKVGNVLDIATDEVMRRLLNAPEHIANKDLASFYTMLQKATNGYQESINGIGENPVIQINTINMDKPQLSPESAQRVLDAYNLWMQFTKTPTETEQTDEVEVIEEEDEE